jgi:hypothetical protein
VLSPELRTHPRRPDATHIFDGLDDFATHVAHMRLGAFATPPTAWPPSAADAAAFGDTLLYRVALRWLGEDRAHRRALEQGGGRKKRGARHDEVRSPSVGCTPVLMRMDRLRRTRRRSTRSRSCRPLVWFDADRLLQI